MKRCAFALWFVCLAVLAGLAVACAVDPDCVSVSILAPVAAFCAFGGATAGLIALL